MNNFKSSYWNVAGIFLLAVAICFLVLTKQHRQTEFQKTVQNLPATPLDQLNAVARPGKLVHVEAVALGDPLVLGANGDEIAVQKLEVFGVEPHEPEAYYSFRPAKNIELSSPELFLVGDGKGQLWIASRDFNHSTVYTNTDTPRDGVNKDWLADYDRYKSSGRVVRVSTIRKGAHISAIGEISKNEKLNHYVLHAPRYAMPGELLLTAH